MNSTILRRSRQHSVVAMTEHSFMCVNKPEESLHLLTPITIIHMIIPMVRIMILKSSELAFDGLPRCASFLRFDDRSGVCTSAQTDRRGFDVIPRGCELQSSIGISSSVEKRPESWQEFSVKIHRSDGVSDGAFWICSSL